MARFVAGTILAVWVLALAPGCGPTVCERLCERNRACLVSDLDVAACASDCQRRVNASSAERSRVLRCVECMEENACDDVVDVCLRECT